MKIEDMDADQLRDFHLQRRDNTGGFVYYMGQSNPHRELLYDLEDDQLHTLNQMLLDGDRDAVVLQLHEWVEQFLEEDGEW